MDSFTLDLRTLLQVLSRQKQNGLLQAEISSEKLRYHGTRQRMLSNVLLENGRVQGCTIALQNGGVFVEGQKALEQLFEVGVIDWNWKSSTAPFLNPKEGEVSTEHPLRTGALSASAGFVPRRTERGEKALPTLAREYRRVLLLVDGQRTGHKLATMLSMSDEDVMAVLRNFQSQGLLF